MTTHDAEFPLEAERCVLGACLLDTDAYERAGDLDGAEFYRDAHRTIWRALGRLKAKGSALDLVTLKDELGDDLERVGGPAYIASLVDGVPRSTHVEHYANIVRRHARARRVQAIGRQIAEHDGDGPIPPDMLDELRSEGAAAADPLASLTTLDAIEARETAVPLARAVFIPGTLGMLFGPSGGGKTTLAAAACAAVSSGADFIGQPTVEGGAPVLIMSAEDTATLAGVVQQMGGDPGRIHVWPDGTVADLPAAIERTGARAVMVDTLSEYAHQHGLDRNSDKDMGDVARGLARFAESTGVAVTILHHEPWSQQPGASDTAARPKGAGDVYTACDWAARCTVDEWKRETTVTRSKGRRELPVESVVFLMGGAGFEPGPPHPGPTGGSNPPGGRYSEADVLEALEATEEPQTVNQIVGAITGNDRTVTRAVRAEIDRLVRGLLHRGEIATVKVRRGRGKGREYDGFAMVRHGAAPHDRTTDDDGAVVRSPSTYVGDREPHPSSPAAPLARARGGDPPNQQEGNMTIDDEFRRIGRMTTDEAAAELTPERAGELVERHDQATAGTRDAIEAMRADDPVIPDDLWQEHVLVFGRERRHVEEWLGEVLVGVELDRPEPGEDALQVSLDSGGAVEWVSVPREAAA